MVDLLWGEVYYEFSRAGDLKLYIPFVGYNMHRVSLPCGTRRPPSGKVM